MIVKLLGAISRLDKLKRCMSEAAARRSCLHAQCVHVIYRSLGLWCARVGSNRNVAVHAGVVFLKLFRDAAHTFAKRKELRFFLRPKMHVP